MEKFKLNINSDVPTLHVAGSLIWAALQMDDVALVSPKDADLVLNVDSIHNVGMVRGKKTAYYEIDDNLHQGKNHQYYDVDLLYIVTKDRLSQYPKHTRYLPVAMEPRFHRYWDFFENTYDIVFMGNTAGNLVYDFRSQVCKVLQDQFNCFFGTCQPQDYAKFLSQGKVLLNVLPQKDDDIPLVNARFFESMGIGCLLQNYHPVLDDFAVEGRDYIGFTTIDEAINKVKYMLSHEEARQRMINNARQNVVENHTWVHRLKQIIKDMKGGD